MTQNSAYDEPAVYDILMTPGTAREADVLERIHTRWIGTRAAELPWLEPACGSGRLLRVLAGRGRRLTGYDASPAMIAYARRRLRGAAGGRVALSVAAMETGPDGIVAGGHGFVLNPWNTFRHLRHDAAALAHLRATAAATHPDGCYVVGLSLSHPEGDPPEEDIWSGTRGRCRVTQVVNYVPPGPEGTERVELVYGHVTVARPSGETHFDTVDRLRTYTEAQWEDLLARSPWRRAEVLDLDGRPRAGRDLPYGLEVLVRRDSCSRRGPS